jgi:hypothetical protein
MIDQGSGVHSIRPLLTMRPSEYKTERRKRYQIARGHAQFGSGGEYRTEWSGGPNGKCVFLSYCPRLSGRAFRWRIVPLAQRKFICGVCDSSIHFEPQTRGPIQSGGQAMCVGHRAAFGGADSTHAYKGASPPLTPIREGSAPR